MFHFHRKKTESEIDKNPEEINKFYTMLSKMKKKRPNMNIKWIMDAIYGKDFNKYIK